MRFRPLDWANVGRGFVSGAKRQASASGEYLGVRHISLLEGGRQPPHFRFPAIDQVPVQAGTISPAKPAGLEAYHTSL